MVANSHISKRTRHAEDGSAIHANVGIVRGCLGYSREPGIGRKDGRSGSK
jgi:hypothetical protein